MAHDKLTGDKGLKLQAMANTNAGQKYSVPENNTRGSSVYVELVGPDIFGLICRKDQRY